MLENERKQEELLDTTDCLEAVGVLKAMKNLLFLIALMCLVVLQVSFWLLDREVVRQASDVVPASVAVPALKAVEPAAAEKTQAAEPSGQETPAAAAEAVKKLESESEAVTKSVEPQKAEEQNEETGELAFYQKFSVWSWLIRFCNFVLIISAVLYSLTLLFSLKISLVGKLGGINHITRAFFLSLFMLVFLLPWQQLFEGVIAGAIYTPGDWLAAGHGGEEGAEVIWAAVYYLRFVVLPVIVVLFLIFAQICAGRWSRATLKRLEVI